VEEQIKITNCGAAQQNRLKNRVPFFLEGASFESSDAGGSSQHTWAFLASD
jgi:hypothetical protein